MKNVYARSIKINTRSNYLFKLTATIIIYSTWILT